MDCAHRQKNSRWNSVPLYTNPVNSVNAFKIDNPKMRTAVRERLNNSIRILSDAQEGGKQYE